MDPPPPPPSRQLVVRFNGCKPKDMAEVRELMDEYGKIRSIRSETPPSLLSILIHYSTTAEATAAKKALDGTTKAGLSVSVEYHPVSQLVMVNSLPIALREHAISIAIGELARISAQYKWIDMAARKNCVFILFNSLADATKAVQHLQDSPIRGWRWELEFHPVRGVLSL